MTTDDDDIRNCARCDSTEAKTFEKGANRIQTCPACGLVIGLGPKAKEKLLEGVDLGFMVPIEMSDEHRAEFARDFPEGVMMQLVPKAAASA